jgi:hypothetical protein
MRWLTIERVRSFLYYAVCNFKSAGAASELYLGSARRCGGQLKRTAFRMNRENKKKEAYKALTGIDVIKTD